MPTRFHRFWSSISAKRFGAIRRAASASNWARIRSSPSIQVDSARANSAGLSNNCHCGWASLANTTKARVTGWSNSGRDGRNERTPIPNLLSRSLNSKRSTSSTYGASTAISSGATPLSTKATIRSATQSTIWVQYLAAPRSIAV